MERREQLHVRDPIRDRPLRDPGESIRDQLQKLLVESAVPWLVIAVFISVTAVIEWARWLVDAKFAPVAVTIVATVVSVYAAWRVFRITAQARDLKVGLKGERFVGQFLQATLIPRGYSIIHDVCIDDFNVDHVAIGPGGVFAIEVKTRMKPGRGKATVSYDGERVLVNGYAPDRDPLIQSRAGAGRIQQIIEQYTGRKVPVRPVVLFPSWFVEKQPLGVTTWVLNEKAFVGFVDREPRNLVREQITVLTEGLARYVRDQLAD